MTLFIACILLYQFDWPWYWYPIAGVIWLAHEYHQFRYFKSIKPAIPPKFR